MPAWPVLLSHWIAAGSVAPPEAQPSQVLAAPRRAGPPGDPLGVSERSLRRAGAEWPRRPTGIPCWRSVRTARAEMMTDARAAEVRWTCYAIEWSLPRVAEALGAGSLPLIYVTLFKTRASFETYGGLPAESLYDPVRRRIILCAEGGRAARLAAVVHELAHALMHHQLGRTGPPWLAEGVAERITGEILASLDVTLQPDWSGVALLGEPAALMTLRPTEFVGADATNNYALALSWVNHLIDREGRSVAELMDWTPAPAELKQVQARWRRHREAHDPAPD